MPSLAALHPNVVHFVVALIVVAALVRWASLAWRAAWLGPAAFALAALGTIAGLVAVRSGTDAHEPVERIPGTHAAVEEHATWGERARNVFVVFLAVEAIAVALATRQHPKARAAAVASAIWGVVAVLVLTRAASLGGTLVYGYGGGVGIRSGDAEDVRRAFIAAVHQQAGQDRAEGRPLDAAQLADLLAARFPDHVEVQLAAAESTLVDRGDPPTALARLNALRISRDDEASRIRAGLLRASALEALNDRSAARQVLETLRTEFPAHPQIRQRLEALTGQP